MYNEILEEGNQKAEGGINDSRTAEEEHRDIAEETGETELERLLAKKRALEAKLQDAQGNLAHTKADSAKLNENQDYNLGNK